MLQPDVTLGMSLSGALTPAGLGCSSIVPLIKAGFVDWIVSTGAILYHDLHFALNFPVHVGSHLFDDTDCAPTTSCASMTFSWAYSDCLMATDEILRGHPHQPEFQKKWARRIAPPHRPLRRRMGAQGGLKDVSVLAAAYRAGVPCYTSSPGDSTIGMNVAGVELRGTSCA